METQAVFAGFAHGGRGINEGAVTGVVFMPNCHASISQAKSEICVIIDSINNNIAKIIPGGLFMYDYQYGK